MPGRQFIYWLAITLAAEREKAGIPVERVAGVLEVSRVTLERFEEGSGYGREPDRYVAGYAYMLGEDDPRKLWQLALDRWVREGAAPDFLDELPGKDFIRSVRETRQRQQPVHGARSETQHATGRRREAR